MKNNWQTTLLYNRENYIYKCLKEIIFNKLNDDLKNLSLKICHDDLASIFAEKFDKKIEYNLNKKIKKFDGSYDEFKHQSIEDFGDDLTTLILVNLVLTDQTFKTYYGNLYFFDTNTIYQNVTYNKITDYNLALKNGFIKPTEIVQIYSLNSKLTDYEKNYLNYNLLFYYR